MAIENGPIFIVGMPRSGTKLLRSLINNHSQVAITPNESNFIPHLSKLFPEDLNQRPVFEKFYDRFCSTTFYRRLSQNHNCISANNWFDQIEDGSFSETIGIFYTAFAHEKGKTVWGDKTPSYINKISLLNKTFANARFIHIIRDVRDYALSINKAWNKNELRAAQRWNDSILECRLQASTVGAQYLEVLYEDLVDTPEKVLIAICDFLQIGYEPEMARLKQSPENISNLKNVDQVVSKNYQKWKHEMDKSLVKKIESLCSNLLLDLGYELDHPHIANSRLGNLELALYTIQDSIHTIIFELKKGDYRKIYDSFLTYQNRNSSKLLR